MCDIHALRELIDAMYAPETEPRTVRELLEHLHPILAAIVYDLSQGETQILRAHEGWRTKFGERLRAEQPQGAGAARAPPPAQVQVVQSRRSTHSAAGARPDATSVGRQPSSSRSGATGARGELAWRPPGVVDFGDEGAVRSARRGERLRQSRHTEYSGVEELSPAVARLFRERQGSSSD